jgi:hypothetical protein
MATTEHFQRLARRTQTALVQVFTALPVTCMRLCCDIQQALTGFGILHNRFGLAINRKNWWFFRLFEMLHELRGIAPECRHGLNVFSAVEGDGLA